MSIRKTHHNINIGNFDEKSYFSKFHYYEIYDSSKNYTKGKFMFDYGKGALTYCFRICVLSHEEGKLIYIVAVEILSSNERAQLAQFCKCNYCTTNDDYDKIMLNQNHCGCIICSDYPKQEFIDEARIARHNFLLQQ